MANIIQHSSKQQPIPLVHEPYHLTGDGILTERQKKWVAAPPNDFSIENPVLYRHAQQEQKKKERQSANLYNAANVRGLLSENLDPPKSSKGIIEKIQEGRKARHNAGYEDLMQELETISLNLEPEIQGLCSSFKEYLDQNDIEIEETMKTIFDDSLLVKFSLKELEAFWKSIEKHSLQRVERIHQLDTSLESVEEKRGKQIGKVLKSYTEILCRIAHLMPPDVRRLLEEEMLKINKSILSNLQAYADLHKKLMTADVEREKKLYNQWTQRCEEWKSLKLAEAIEKHKQYMNSDSICNSVNIQEKLTELIAEQTLLNDKRMELLNQLRDMKPPSSTKTAVYQWNQAITKLTDQLDQLHLKYMSFVRLEHSKIYNECNDYVIQLKNELFNGGVVAEVVLEELMQDSFLPLLGERKAIFECEEEMLEKNFNQIAAEQKQNLKILFKFAQGAAHLWDNHELGLSKEERALQEMLDKNRRDHDYQNQMKEAKLDIVMDRMRQESSEESLSSSLKLVLQMMDEIRKGYMEFFEQQKSICEKYPRMVSEELHRYATTLYKYFNVVKQRKISTLVESDQQKKLPTVKLSSGVIYEQIEDENSPLSHSTDTLNIDAASSHTFMTTADDNDIPIEQQPYIKNIMVPPNLMVDLKSNMRLEFLEHMEKWKADAVKRAESSVVAKNEETGNELDLRLHLHKPRPGRAEKDVHDVRIAELVLHRERVEQHCNGVSDALSLLKVSYQQMLDDHSKQNEIFRNSVEKLEESFSNAINTQELKLLQDEVNGNLNKFMEIIRASVRQYRTYIDDMLNKLRHSNATFRKAFQIFSEGGNFSPDEVEEHRKKLEKSSTKIDNCEGSLIGELEGLETKRMDVAKEFAGKLEDKFKHHLFDLTFIEKIQRWLSNIQVKIKSEVANSNSQSQQLSKMIAVFNRRIEQLQDPMLEKQKYTAEQLHEILVPLVKCFQDRVRYLNCGTVKNISSLFSLQENMTKNENAKESAKRKLKKSSKKLSAKNRMNRTGSRQSPNSLSPTKSPVSQTSKESCSNDDVMQTTESTFKPLSSYGNRQSSGCRVTQYGGKYDRRYLVFGEFNPDEDEKKMSYTTLQLRILQNGLDGLLSTAELYYRQKGQRPTTRNQLISDSFDTCAESLIQRLRKYKKQTEVYHNSCIQELRDQIKTFLEGVQKLPYLLVVSISANHQQALEDEKESIEKQFLVKKEHNERRKKEYQTLLRPTLGHPNNKLELNKLVLFEQERQKERQLLRETFASSMQESEKSYLMKLIEQLQSTSVRMMSQLDKMVTLDDVIEGQSTAKPKTEKELLKEKLFGQKTEIKTELEEDVLKEPFTWPSVDLQGLSWIDDVFSLEDEITAIVIAVQSEKQTKVHRALIQSRDDEIKKVINTSIANMNSLSDYCAGLMSEEERWTDNWKTSLKKIMQLY